MGGSQHRMALRWEQPERAAGPHRIEPFWTEPALHLTWEEWPHRVRRGANRSRVRPRTAEQGPRARGCAPDPVREAPVREGALKAAIDICETGRNASAPANGPAANGSQPHPVAGCLRTGTNAGLHTPTRSHPQRGPCSALRCVHLARIC